MEFNIPVPWGHVAALHWGSRTGKRVLAIHGWQENAGSFDRLVPLLPTDWNIVCLDMPSHGRSSHSAEGTPLYLIDHVYTLRRVVLHLKWERFNFICHSLGWAFGMIYTCLYPDEVEHFVSLDVVAPFLFSTSDQSFAQSLAGLFEQRMKYELDDYKPKSYTREEAIEIIQKRQHGSMPYDSVVKLLKRGTKAVTDHKVVFTRDRRLNFSLPVMAQITIEQFKTLLENLKSKLIIIKAKNGWYVNKDYYPEFIEMYQKKLGSGFQYVEVDGTHHVHLNNPEIVARHITNFINSTAPLEIDTIVQSKL